MFRRERWAAAFMDMPVNAETALACLKALVPLVKDLPDASRGGHCAASRLEKIMRGGLEAVPLSAGEKTAAEYALRFLVLLIEKNCFARADSVLEKIENRVNEQNGTISVTAESAFPMDSLFTEELSRGIAERTGAAGIKLTNVVVPELLGGYRLRIGSFFVDASLKGQIEQMTAELAAVSASPASCEGM